MVAELERIRGGWSAVPEHLKTKTQLNKLGLKPNGEPVAVVWSYKDWVFLYDIKDTKEKRKPSEKQLAALEKARQIRQENEIRRQKEEEEERWRRYEEERKEYGLSTFGAWYHKDFVILDTETTDLDGEIIEIAIIDKHENVLFNSFVKPKGEISEGAYYVHGISKEMLVDAPTWPEVYPKIKEILKDRLVLIYNDVFDVERIWTSCHAWGLETIHPDTRCVMRTYADYWDSRWIKLSEASGNWEQDHRSLSDCIDTLKVVRDMWKELGIGDEVK